jgi:hypothetical protein
MKLLARMLCCFLIAATLPAQEKNSNAGPSLPYHIAGKIVDAATNEPLAHVAVTLAPVLQLDQFSGVIAGEDGGFRFDHLAPGKYVLAAEARGYLNQMYEQHDGFYTGIVVGPEADPGELVFRLQRDCSISGRVTDEHGEAVRGAEIQLFQSTEPAASEDDSGQSAESDDEGNFRLRHLSPGKYFLSVTAVPWYTSLLRQTADVRDVEDNATALAEDSPLARLYPLTYYPGAINRSGAAAIALNPGDQFRADISLQPLQAFHVVLPFPAGSSQQAFSVDLQQRLFGGATVPVSALSEVAAVKEGKIEIAGLTPGDYELQMNSVDAENGKITESYSLALEVGTDGQATTSGLTTAVPVDGSAIGMSENDFSSVGAVKLRNQKTGRIFDAPISDNGSFGFLTGIPPGTYDLGISAQGIFLRSVKATGARVTGTSVRIGDSPAVTLTLKLTDKVNRVEGVALKDGKPFGTAMVLLVPADAEHNSELLRRDQSDSDGTFTLRDALSGNYTLLALENAWNLDLSNPSVLKPYLAGGTPVVVRGSQPANVKVKVQTVYAPH